MGFQVVSSVVLISSEMGGSLAALENLRLSDVKLWHLNLVILDIKSSLERVRESQSCMKKHVFCIHIHIYI